MLFHECSELAGISTNDRPSNRDECSLAFETPDFSSGRFFVKKADQKIRGESVNTVRAFFNDGRMESVRNCVDYRSGCRRRLRRFGAITSNDVLLHRGLQDDEDDRALR
jgi:hypothetical protein